MESPAGRATLLAKRSTIHPLSSLASDVRLAPVVPPCLQGHDRADLLRPGMPRCERFRPEHVVLFSLVEEEDDGVVRSRVRLQRACNFQRRHDTHSAVARSRAGRHRVVVHREQHRFALAPALDARHHVRADGRRRPGGSPPRLQRGYRGSVGFPSGPVFAAGRHRQTSQPRCLSIVQVWPARQRCPRYSAQMVRLSFPCAQAPASASTSTAIARPIDWAERTPIGAPGGKKIIFIRPPQNSVCPQSQSWQERSRPSLNVSVANIHPRAGSTASPCPPDPVSPLRCGLVSVMQTSEPRPRHSSAVWNLACCRATAGSSRRRWRSLSTTTWSSNSRRTLPMQRSATPFCQGLRYAILVGRRPAVVRTTRARLRSKWAFEQQVRQMP